MHKSSLRYLFPLCAPQAQKLTLAELELATCTGLTGFLTLNLTRVTRHEAVLLEHRAHLRIDFAEGAGDTQAGSLSLAFDSATVESDGDVEIFSGRKFPTESRCPGVSG